MREVELKAVVDDVAALRNRLRGANAVLTFAGGLIDRRYDAKDGSLVAGDNVLRLRTFMTADGVERSVLDWKGPTTIVDGYKVREETSVSIGDAATLGSMLASLGYVVVREIDRDIEMFELEGAVVRIEHYPRLDTLVEVEGTPETIERAIARTGIARAAFSSDRLLSFVTRFEARSGLRAALSRRDLQAVAEGVR